jgi:phosphatidylglycerophosphate synthase
MNRWQFILERTLIGLSLKKEEQAVSEKILTLPNGITVFGFLTLFLYQANYIYAYFNNDVGFLSVYIALFLLFLAIASDILDGFFARALNSCSRFGELLDPARDRYLAFVIVLQMVLVEKTLSIVLIVALIILVEFFTAIKNWKYSTRVHTVGKFRMGIHMLCGAVFVIQVYRIPTPINLTISTQALATVMLLATILASVRYRELNL